MSEWVSEKGFNSSYGKMYVYQLRDPPRDGTTLFSSSSLSSLPETLCEEAVAVIFISSIHSDIKNDLFYVNELTCCGL